MSRIEDYAMLGDCQSAALVDTRGSVDWWCAPRFDSRSVFARLLDPAAGHFFIRPQQPFTVVRAYLEDTMVLETTFTTEDGAVRLTDALALGLGERGHEIGTGAPHVLLRRVEGLAGEVTILVEFAPRLEYGLVRPMLRETGAGVRTSGGPDTLELRTSERLELDGGTAGARIPVSAGRRFDFALSHATGSPRAAADEPVADLDDTVAAWRSWAEEHRGYSGAYRSEVRRSALVLQALTYRPSGAVVAAPTTSLPEIPGGSWNWDYRYAWLRDASLALKALWVGACPDEASRYFEWMARAAVGGPGDDIQIMFGVEGERDLTEHALEHLAGHGGAQPVRIGNDAWRQRQLDVYGEILEAAWVLRDRLGDLDPLVREFLGTLADRAAALWREPDAGIWEGREGERHYVSSKLWCWVALDRAVRMEAQLHAGARLQTWRRERDAVRAAILERGWDESVGAYTGAFGSDHLDASVLLMALVGFLPDDDARLRRTIATIERELGEGGLIRRWTGAEEGSFVICSYWLAHALAVTGRLDDARAVFERITRCANDVGLLAEEVDPADGRHWGNFPQAFSHVGLINAAWAITEMQ